MKMPMITFDTTTQQLDLAAVDSTFLAWLENAITISLFTDARASDDEVAGNDKRGYWGDMDLPSDESLGSKLWLLKREKITPDVINTTRDYCVEALMWLVDEEHLLATDITTARSGNDRITILIKCQLPDGTWHKTQREHQHAV